MTKDYCRFLRHLFKCANDQPERDPRSPEHRSISSCLQLAIPTSRTLLTYGINLRLDRQSQRDGGAYMVLGMVDLKTPRLLGGDPQKAVAEMEKGLPFVRTNAFCVFICPRLIKPWAVPQTRVTN